VTSSCSHKVEGRRRDERSREDQWRESCSRERRHRRHRSRRSRRSQERSRGRESDRESDRPRERERERGSAAQGELLGEGDRRPRERRKPHCCTPLCELRHEVRCRPGCSCCHQLHTSWQRRESGNARENRTSRSRERREWWPGRSRDDGRRWPRRRVKRSQRLGLRLNHERCLAIPILTELLHPCLMRSFRIRTPSPAQYRIVNSVHSSVVDLFLFIQEERLAVRHHGVVGGEGGGRGGEEDGWRWRRRRRASASQSATNSSRRWWW
jgi:hypothetical protein